MKVFATARNLKISAQKLRLSADQLRGKRAIDGLKLMAVMPQKSSEMVYDLLHSAMANATHNYNLSKTNLVIDEVRVDQGSKLKRFRPRARGSSARIIHPTAHLRIVLDDTNNLKKSKETV